METTPLLRKALSVFSPLRGARHTELSAIASADDDPATRPDPYLLSIAKASIGNAQHAEIEKYLPAPRSSLIWPGEHYALLAGIVLAIQPKRIVEFGTGDGLSAVAMLRDLPKAGYIATYDLMPQTASSYIEKPMIFDQRRHDLKKKTGRIKTEVRDLSRPLEEDTTSDGVIDRERLRHADLIFIDGPKDGKTERRLLHNLETIGLKHGCILVFDDIRLWPMLTIWRGIKHPKLDLTGFGHWTGTGMVRWTTPEGIAKECEIQKNPRNSKPKLWLKNSIVLEAKQ